MDGVGAFRSAGDPHLVSGGHAVAASDRNGGEVGVRGPQTPAVVDRDREPAGDRSGKADPPETGGADPAPGVGGEVDTPMACVGANRRKRLHHRTRDGWPEPGARDAETRCGEQHESQNSGSMHRSSSLLPPLSEATVHLASDTRKARLHTGTILAHLHPPPKDTPMSVGYRLANRVAIVTIERPETRNAVDRATAEALLATWRRFDADDSADVGVLTGGGGTFCSGADLKRFDLVDGPHGHLGMSRLRVGKPTIAAIEGHAVAGGLELALWCDLRVVAADAILGCFERRWGVPLIDGGTQRLPRIVGLGRAMDLVLTGRSVGAEEALAIGLANRVAPPGETLQAALALADEISRFPQATVRSDRAAMLDGLGLDLERGLAVEREHGLAVLDTAIAGAARFAAGAGRHGGVDTG